MEEKKGQKIKLETGNRKNGLINKTITLKYCSRTTY